MLKAHVSVDPDSELIDEVVVTAGNVHDSTPVTDLLASHAGDQVKPTVMGDCAMEPPRPSNVSPRPAGTT